MVVCVIFKKQLPNFVISILHSKHATNCIADHFRAKNLYEYFDFPVPMLNAVQYFADGVQLKVTCCVASFGENWTAALWRKIRSFYQTFTVSELIRWITADA